MSVEIQLICESSGGTIQIPEGDSVVGRGPFLKVVDKRVSRNHAVLSWKGGQFTLCPKHANPCFYKASGESSYLRLVKDKTQVLLNGDTFSLLPDGELSYKVVRKSTTISPASVVKKKEEDAEMEVGKTESKVVSEGSRKDDTSKETHGVDNILFGDLSPKSEVARGRSSEAEKPHSPLPPPHVGTLKVKEKSLESPSPSLPKPAPESSSSSSPPKLSRAENSSVPQSLSSSSPPKLSRAESSSTGRKRVLPSWLSAVSGSTAAVGAKTSKEGAASNRPKKAATKRKGPATAASADEKSLEDSAGDSLKASLPTPPPAKKLKKKASPVKKEETKDSSPEAATAKPAAKDASDRKKPPCPCPYGAKCYRKNPAHFREYSHDFAADEDSSAEEDSAPIGDKPVCQYGARCYRKNLAHLRDYDHPEPGEEESRGRARRSRAAKAKKSALKDDSDDDGLPNTYDYQDSFIDDDGGVLESSSSYGESEDSDWVAPADKHDEDDDLNELLTEAKDYVSNKKMRR